MTKGMEKNKGGMSIFGTDFASKGLSWAGNLYHRWENICLDNMIVQDTSKFVDAVSEQFRKVCEEVADDLLKPFSDGCVKGPVTDLSLEHDVIAVICNKFKTDGQDERKQACEILGQKISMAPTKVKGCNCSSEISGDHENVSADFANNPGSLSSADKVPSEFPVNIPGSGSLISHCTIPTEQNGTSVSEDEISLVRSMAKAYEQKCSSSELEMPLTLMEIADTCMGEYEEFEDVKLEDLFDGTTQVDCWEDAEKYELTLIPHRAKKSQSYKKKLTDVLNSSLYSLKKNHGASFDAAINADLLKTERITSLSVSSGGLEKRDPSTTESESEWELL
uniref:Glycerol-3-phosphate dehydrogenase [NAD(+)] n=1 Tax=Anthurium amnicola TaxID=1678845 RepID=A0A1D1ZCB0_9ARAE